MRIFPYSWLVACLLLFSQCTTRNNNPEGGNAEDGVANATESAIGTADPNAVNTVKRGMVVASPTPRKLKGAEAEKNIIYRFQPFEHDDMHLRLTTASNDDGKGIAEQQEIDLAAYANKIIEVQGSSFGRRWVFDAKINGIVAAGGDSARALIPGTSPSLNQDSL